MSLVVPDSGYYKKRDKYVIDYDAQDVMDYSLDYTKWLAKSGGDSIANCTVTAHPSLTVENTSFDTKTTTAWVSGGTDVKVGELLPVTFHITTANTPARQRDFTIYLHRIER